MFLPAGWATAQIKRIRASQNRVYTHILQEDLMGYSMQSARRPADKKYRLRSNPLGAAHAIWLYFNQRDLSLHMRIL